MAATAVTPPTKEFGFNAPPEEVGEGKVGVGTDG
jgi:hypothetical protein